MDKFQVLQEFWSSFGDDAYDENTVPTGTYRPELPYITYQAAATDFNYPVNLRASLWYYGSSWMPISQKMLEISKVLANGGTILQCDGGAVWIKKREPFAQRMSDPNDMIRRYVISITAEFWTAE